jgi:uncharacterized membrane protein YidH (DUF202 family)
MPPDRPDGDLMRTRLANERTQLAWWRTGFAAIAVALATGRLLPELAHSKNQWPYTLVGVGFALFGIAVIALGTQRAREVDRVTGGSRATHPTDVVLLWLTAIAIVLGCAAVAIILAY